MNVIVCYKIVPDEQDIVVKSDRTLSLDKAEWRIGQYDLPAVEAGMQIVEAQGGKVSALSVGSKQLENSKVKKNILSRGPEDLFIVVDEVLQNADTFQTAQALAAAVQKIGDYDLVLFGAGSSDIYAQQVGTQVGELLGLPNINAVSKIEVQDNKLIVERTLEDELEVLEVALPAVISVSSDINQPRVASMKEILAAGKKPVTQWTISDIGLTESKSATNIVSVLAPEEVERACEIVEGESEDAINAFFEALKKAL
jgi:electron transfer flavoprotein beta subunit